MRRRLVLSAGATAALAAVVGVGILRGLTNMRAAVDRHERSFTLIERAEGIRRLVGQVARQPDPPVGVALHGRLHALAAYEESLPNQTNPSRGLRESVRFDSRRLTDLAALLTDTVGRGVVVGASGRESRAYLVEEMDIELTRLAGDVLMWSAVELSVLRGRLVAFSQLAGAALVLLAVMSFGAAWWLNARVGRGLHQLEQAAMAVSVGDLGYRIPYAAGDEVAHVAEAFNRMVVERRKAMAGLTESEERLRLALAAANQGLYDIAVQTGAMTVNPEYCRMIGYDPDELTETVANLHNRLHPDDRDRVIQAYGDFIAGRRSEFSVEFRQRTTHGGFRWMLSVGRIVEWDAEGRPVRMLGTHTDITADREVQEELRSSREQLRRLAVAQEEAREAERGRMARELHDELGQALTGLKMDLRWLYDRLPPDDDPARSRAEEALSLADTTVEAVRRVAAELRPAILDDIGLASAIPWQAREFSRRSGTEVTVTGADHIPAIESGKATAVYRILQESLTNIARHSQATAVEIEVQTDADWLRLDIRDNGKGIEPAVPDQRRPLGILGMQERARAWNGSVVVSPQPAGGTRVRVLMPIGGGEAVSLGQVADR